MAPSTRPRVWIDPAKTQHRRDFFTTVAEAGIHHRMRKLRTKASGKGGPPPPPPPSLP